MKITTEYFYQEVCNFRTLMGQKTFWSLPPEKRQLAIDGLSYVYLNISHDDTTPLTREENEKVADVLHSTLHEFSRRESFALFLDSPS